VADIDFTLLSDGSSDQALIAILTWLLQRCGVKGAIQGQWPDFSLLPQPPKPLAKRIKMAVELSPCNLLFVHRDAERAGLQERKSEIVDASKVLGDLPAVCVVPVRMQEAWLLFDAAALRRAAGNPNGDVELSLPRLADLEGLPSPKETLHGLLREASGLQGRRRKKFRVHTVARRIVDFIEDFSPLLGLPAFLSLERDVREIVGRQGWDS
jgi:hypothetical protein